MASDFDPYYRWLGIPPEEQPPDHYRLLGVVRFESDREVISNASDQRMTHLRTFASGKHSAESQRLLNEVSTATRCLLDPAKKTPYDAQLRAATPKATQSAKELPVAQALPATAPLPVRPLPVQSPAAVPQAAPVATATAYATPPPLIAESQPHIAIRRPARRSGNSGMTWAVLGLVLLAVIGGGTIFAFRMAQDQTVSIPGDPITPQKTNPMPGTTDPGAVKPAPRPATDAERRVWHYARSPEGAEGVVYHVRGKNWVEKASDGRTNHFVEAETTDAAVSLRDASRNLTIWLKPNEMTFAHDGGKETFCMAGGWVERDKLTPLLAALNSAKSEQRTVWFYPDQNGRRGHFRHQGGKDWEEYEEDALKFRYRETARTEEYVELQHEGGGFKVRLYDNRADATLNQPEFKQTAKGEWITAAQLAARMKVPTPGSTRPDPVRPVTTLVFNGDGRATLKSVDGLLNAGKPFTVEFWYRRTSDPAAAAGLMQLGELNLVLRTESSDGNARGSWQLFSAAAGKAWNAAEEVTLDQQWHHLAICGDAGRVEVYHDGKRSHSGSLADLGVSELEPLAFGLAQSSAGSESLTGEIKSIRISDTAQYSAGQAFTPPPAQESALPPGATLALSNVKTSTDGMPPLPMPDPVNPPIGVPMPEPVAERTAPPDAEALQTAQAKIAAVYGDRIKLALKPDDKQKLSDEMLKTAVADSDPAHSYALLLEARRLAVSAMDVERGIEIINEIDRLFDVERVVLLEKLLSDLERRSLALPQREVLIEQALGGTRAALRQDKVTIADSLSVLATKSASKTKDPIKKKAAIALREQVVATKSASDDRDAALEKLKSSPDDPQAHLALGRYLALALGDFQTGCEHLVKGSDAALAAAASQHLAASSDEERLAAVETWHTLLTSLKSPAEKLQLQRHILEVCQEMVPRLTGLPQAQAEKHISRIKPIVAEADKFNSTPIRTPARLAPGLLARLMVGRINPIPTPYVAVASDAEDLARIEAITLARAAGAFTPRFALYGVIVVDHDMEVELRFENCTCQLNGRPFRSTGLQKVPMKKGTYPITIVTAPSNFNFSATGPGSADSLFFHSERDLEAELAKTIPDATGVPIKSERVN